MVSKDQPSAYQLNVMYGDETIGIQHFDRLAKHILEKSQYLKAQAAEIPRITV
ncbi:hypothetical protein ACMZOO_08310 [Catenovulum sp. SX2]|uniref:hypothetical protein n=1 Tax=Catenovulum sp. SX2 TaxID=3398614 RepID=UPI003F87BC7C